jgi:ribosomal protein L7/L12
VTIVYVVLAVVAVAFVVDAFNRRRIRNLQQSGLYPPAGQGGAPDVERLVALGRRIDAIKLYRKIHGTDLKTAKDAIDKITARADLRLR